LENLAR